MAYPATKSQRVERCTAHKDSDLTFEQIADLPRLKTAAMLNEFLKRNPWRAA